MKTYKLRFGVWRMPRVAGFNLTWLINAIFTEWQRIGTYRIAGVVGSAIFKRKVSMNDCRDQDKR